MLSCSLFNTFKTPRSTIINIDLVDLNRIMPKRREADKEATPLLAAVKGFPKHSRRQSFRDERKVIKKHTSQTQSGEALPLFTTQSSTSRADDINKYEGRKYSVSLRDFLTGMSQDIREFLFPTSKIYHRTDQNGNVIMPIDRVIYETTHRTNVVYYEDQFNDLPWTCTVGTSHDDGIWYNRADYPGIVMSSMVWVLITYSGLTITLLARQNDLPNFIAAFYCTICALALASHAKTSLTDPGAVPNSAVPTGSHEKPVLARKHPLCMKCNSFKPPKSHHCRICNRCISGMDHHCPWMNNCVGNANHKHFLLFLIYVWTASTYALLIFFTNYFFCSSEECTFSPVLVHLVRVMTVLCIGALLFTTNMLTNEIQGIITGIGTIDRIKRKAKKTLQQSDDEPMSLTDIFGIGPYIYWFLPVDPVFEDYDRVMGYSTTPRLLREKSFGTPKNQVVSSPDGMLKYFRDI